MKPLHVGLLVIGAAVAGGLAVKMTQAPAFQTTPAPKPARTVAPDRPAQPSAKTMPPVNVAPAASATVSEPTAPPPVFSETKPSAQSASPKMPVSGKSKPAQALKPFQNAKNVPPPYRSQPETDAPVTVRSAPEPALAQTAALPPVESVQPPPEPEPLPPVPAPRRVVLTAGTTISARIIESLASDKVHAGDNFQATLSEPLIAGDLVIAERGARVTGKVVDSNQAGKFQGVSKLELALISVYCSDGQKIAISTSTWKKQGESQRNGDVARIGGGAALGAIIGAIAGGGKGAAIGAGVGGAAGTGTVMIPQTKPTVVPTETIIQFRLSAPVTVTERI